MRFIDPDGRFALFPGFSQGDDPWLKLRGIFQIFGFNVTNRGIEHSNDKQVLAEQASMRKSAQQVGATIEAAYEAQKNVVTLAVPGSDGLYAGLEGRNGASALETGEQLLYAAIGFIPVGKVAKESTKLLNQFNSTESLIQGAGNLTKVNAGLQGFVKGNGPSIFKAITQGSVGTTSRGGIIMKDGKCGSVGGKNAQLAVYSMQTEEAHLLEVLQGGCIIIFLCLTEFPIV